MSAAALAALAGVIALVAVLPGWLAGSDLLVRLWPDFAAMVPVTAFCVLLLAIAIGLTLRDYRATFRGARIAAGTALGLALVNFILQALTGAGIGARLFPEAFAPSDAMAPATAAGIVLAAVAVMSLRTSRRTSEVCATLGLSLAMLGLVGYLLDSAALYRFFVFSAMALNTALSLTAISLAVLLISPERTWTGLLLGDRPGSRTARRFFPLALIVPLIVSGGALLLTETGHVPPNFRLSLLTVVLMAASATGVLANAAVENRAERRLLDNIGELERSNADRVLLLREVYHRVKNNLQQINAMLRLEARKVDDPRLTESFTAMTERVRALGIVHQMLISAPTPSEVDLPDFLGRLSDALASSHGVARRDISVELEADEGRGHLDFAVSLGLIVNELLSNAVKHAFGPEDSGTVRVRYEAGDETLRLQVRDDGRGAPPDFLESNGTGALLVRSMARQLKGEIDTDTSAGTCVTVTMPADIQEHGRYE